jgi:hypothetical protein
VHEVKVRSESKDRQVKPFPPVAKPARGRAGAGAGPRPGLPMRAAAALTVALAAAVLHGAEGLTGTPCAQGSCFAQLPALCGSSATLPAAHAATLGLLCGEPNEFPYVYDYDPANTSQATFAQYFKDAQANTPQGFARALIEASYNTATPELRSDGSCGGAPSTWATAGTVLQVRAARRFAARAYMLAAETTLDMANVGGIGDLSADEMLSLLLNRTISGARGFCGLCGVWLSRLLNDAVLPNHTAAAAVPLYLANNYPGYPESGGLTHVLNTVPMLLPGTEELIYATHDAYFSYEFVHCSDHSAPLDLREMLRMIIARNVSDICVPPPDDRLYFPRLELQADHAHANASVSIHRQWGGWASLADKTTDFGAWVNRTLALFGCPTSEEDSVGNFYYYMLVAGWGGDVDAKFKNEVTSLVCGKENPCKLAPQHLPLCVPPPPPPSPPHDGKKCCWNRDIQGCSSSSQCDPGGEGCVATGTLTKRYGRVACDTCEQQGRVYNHTCSCCGSESGGGS